MYGMGTNRQHKAVSVPDPTSWHPVDRLQKGFAHAPAPDQPVTMTP